MWVRLLQEPKPPDPARRAMRTHTHHTHATGPCYMGLICTLTRRLSREQTRGLVAV